MGRGTSVNEYLEFPNAIGRGNMQTSAKSTKVSAKIANNQVLGTLENTEDLSSSWVLASLQLQCQTLCCPCRPRGPENPENSSRSTVGPKVAFGGSLKVGQKYRSSKVHTFLYFRPSPQNLLSELLFTYLNCLKVLGASRRTRAT